ncbi:ribonuclease HII [Microbacterium sp. YY-01]|uniref:ribonuclease HII n=1 Tax=Microbacterium sp. YY-01 TaxID=3421634 RepID=UPI003D1853A8
MMAVVEPTLQLEHRMLHTYSHLIALDEVGRGALAGPVAVGAVVVDRRCAQLPIPQGLRDSKLVPLKQRDAVAQRAQDWVVGFAVGRAEAPEIDEVGIIRALGLAASRAISAVVMHVADSDGVGVLLDGTHDYLSSVHPEKMNVHTVAKGDRDCASISAASIVAKVTRDAVMASLHDEYPAYDWQSNKGYASAHHRAAIRGLGLTPYHRASWTIRDAPALF